MIDWFNRERLGELLTQAWANFSTLAQTPELWIQVGLIGLVFVIARWLLTPLLQTLLIRLRTANISVANFDKIVSTLHEFSNTLVWLALQWVVIEIYAYLEKSPYLLNPVASLLSAWLLIRLATKLLENPIASKVISTFAWTFAILNIFNLLEPTLKILDSLAFNIGSVRLSPLIIIKAGVALWLSLWLANVFAGFLDRKLKSTDEVSPAMRVLSVKLLNLGLVIAAFLITFSAVGIDLTALAIFGGALGVGLGFGLQKIFSNLVSGVILLMDRSIKPGDVIAVGTTVGWINNLSARYVSVITRDGIEHLIPNETLVTDRVENWSYSDDLIRLRIPVGISYKSDVRLAMALCIEAALDTARIQKTPEPKCLLKGFGDSSVDLELRVWIDDPSNGRSNVMSDVLLGIWERFKLNNIEIPFPQRDLHLKSGLNSNSIIEETKQDPKK